MQRDNYYIVLDLPINPPENDINAIDAAILRKKAEWSRLRNHPTKGLMAQKYINMIPDMERVLKDDALRAQEAANALEVMAEGKESKISEIDSHLEILMGKGYIAQEDIARLAEIHGLDQSDIQDRINAKKDADFTRVDQQIHLRMGKGYLTEAELARLAKQNGMEPEELRKRVRCPILKDEKEAADLKPRQIDKSIEKAIVDNLKIVGKANLYEFLGATGNPDLEILQAKAAKKKKDLGQIAKKDAVATAGNILVGHCLTIFKTEETRVAYDVSLALAKLASLDSDINVAAANGKIRHEYVGALITKAMSFGMDRQEATEYLKTYCQKRKYRLEQKPEKKRLLLMAAGALVLSLLVLTAGGYALFSIHEKNSAKNEYDQLLQSVNGQPKGEKQIELLQKYADTHKSSEYAQDALGRIQKIHESLESERVARFMEETEALVRAGDYTGALKRYEAELAAAKDPKCQKTLQEKIRNLNALREEKAFEAVNAVSVKGEPDEKMAQYQQYLSDHPDGKNKDQVTALINEMAGEYYIYVSRRLEMLKQAEKWDEGLALCKKYIETYDNSNADLLKQMIPDLEEKILGEKIFAGLKEKAAAKGNDHAAALGVFSDYLAAYPETHIQAKIEKEMERLKEVIKTETIKQALQALRERLAGTGGRFQERGDGIVLDTKTGLMWQLMDSSVVLQKDCMTYEEGKAYIKGLKTNGLTGWRLPTPGELTGLYTTKPSFPASGAVSYWTSEHYTGYSDGWHVMVDCVTTMDGKRWDTIRKDAEDCGAIRAVR